MWSTAGNDVIDEIMSKLDCDQSAGPDSRQGGELDSCPGASTKTAKKLLPKET